MTEYQEHNGTAYHAETAMTVINALENARHNGTRVRLFYGDTKTGKAWTEEHDVSGTIGRSTGTRKIPLLIANVRSYSGGGILDHCIVAILTGPNTFAYRHPNFDVGKWELLRSEWSDDPRPFLVNHDGQAHAAFTKEKSAQNYIAFMRGERLAK